MNEGNIRTLCTELVEYLKVCDPEFKQDLTSKICMLVQRYAPDKRWYIQTMAQVGRGEGRMPRQSCGALQPASLCVAGLPDAGAALDFAAACPGWGLRRGGGLPRADGGHHQRNRVARLCGLDALPGAGGQAQHRAGLAAEGRDLVHW